MLLTQTAVRGSASSGFVNIQSIQIQTTQGLEFIDLTEKIQDVVAASGIHNGLINIQSRHTTAAIVVNENEPLLIEDLKKTLERLAPQTETYSHDDFSIRTVNMQPEEDQNGHSHCKAIFLPTSCILNVCNGNLDLGRWQRIFLVELDRPKQRSISIVILGA